MFRVPLLSTLGEPRIHFEIRAQCHLVVYRSCASKSESFCYTYVGELKMAAPSEEKLICDKFNLEALTVNQVKAPFSPPLADLEYISRFNISLVTATSTRIQSEDVLHGAHVIDEM
jgi:hypothetical protein